MQTLHDIIDKDPDISTHIKRTPRPDGKLWVHKEGTFGERGATVALFYNACGVCFSYYGNF
jgi:hypothetical protein